MAQKSRIDNSTFFRDHPNDIHSAAMYHPNNILSIAIQCLMVRYLFLLTELTVNVSFWAADPKGTMSYRTEGGISVRPSERASKRPNI